jgi:hypothetical protein
VNKPHKHAELIKAWADGAEVEYRLNDGLKGWSEWKMLAHDKPFLSDSWWEYRIKPEPAPDVVKTYNVSLSWGWADQPHNLKLTFDGVSGHLRKAEVI